MKTVKDRLMRRRMFAVAGLVTGLFLALMSVGASAGLAAQPACTDSWKAAVSGAWSNPADWSTGAIPVTTDNVCVTIPGTYTVTLTPYVPQAVNSTTQGGDTVASLALGASAGTQTLDVSGQSWTTSSNETANAVTLTVTGDDVISAGGALVLDATGTGASSGSSQGGAAVLNAGSLTNAGTLTSQVEDPNWNNSLGGTIANSGTISLASGELSMPTPNNGGTGAQNNFTLTNSGTLSVAAPAELLLNQPGTGSSPSTFTNAGTIANAGTIVAQSNGGGMTWDQTGGALSGNAVQLQSGALLNDSGGTGGFIYTYNGGGIEGTVPAGQTVTFQGTSYITSSNETSNTDVFDLEGKTLINDGTIVLDATASGPPTGGTTGGISELNDGALQNAGTLDLTVSDPSYFDDLEIGVANQAGATINLLSGKTQFTHGGTVTNDGTITIAPSATLDELANPYLTGPEKFINAADGTIVPQLASATSFGTLQLGGNSSFSAGGTVDPQLIGGFIPTPGEAFGVFPAGGATATGTFATVGGGFSADYSMESASPASIGLVYGPTPSTGGPAPTGPGTPGSSPRHPTAKLGSLKLSGQRLKVSLACARTGVSCAKETITVSVTEKFRGGRLVALSALESTKRKPVKTITRKLVIATTSITLGSGKSKTLELTLNRAGRALLARERRLTAAVVITVGSKTVKRTTIHVRAPAPKPVRRGQPT